MLKFLACFKMTDDLDEATMDEWNLCLENGGEPKFLTQILGTYDEAALEMVLRLKEDAFALGEEVQTVALTVGSAPPDTVVKNLFGVCYDRVVCIDCDEDLRFASSAVADMIADFVVQDGGFDLIVTGQQANVGNQAQTHLYLANRLDVPCILHVTNAALEQDGLAVTSMTDSWTIRQQARLPLILGVENTTHPYLRVATLRERMAAKHKQMELQEKVSLSEEAGRKTKLLGLHREVKTSNCRIIKGDSAKEKAGELFHTCLEEVLLK